MVGGLLLTGALVLGGCNGSTASASTSSTPTMATNGLVIDATSAVPVFVGKATTSVVYVRNHSTQTISDIRYSAYDDLNESGNAFSIVSNQCTTLVAGEVCPLSFTIPSLHTKSQHNNALISADYKLDNQAHAAFRVIPFTLVDSTNWGVYFSESASNLSKEMTIYAYATQTSTYQVNPQTQDLTVNATTLSSDNIVNGGQVLAFAVENQSNAASLKLAINEAQIPLTSAREMVSTFNLKAPPSTAILSVFSNQSTLINTNTTQSGAVLIVNGGTASAGLTLPPTFSNPNVVYSASGQTPVCPANLTTNNYCYVNFNITNYESNPNGTSLMTITYTGGSPSPNTLSYNNISWVTPNSAPLLSIAPTVGSIHSSVLANYTFNVILKNVGGKVINSVNTSIALTGATSTTTPTITSSDCSSLSVDGTCTLSVGLRGVALDAGSIRFTTTGNYGNNATYQRVFLLPYKITPLDIIIGTGGNIISSTDQW